MIVPQKAKILTGQITPTACFPHNPTSSKKHLVDDANTSPSSKNQKKIKRLSITLLLHCEYRKLIASHMV